jgi:hypothetical protein
MKNCLPSNPTEGAIWSTRPAELVTEPTESVARPVEVTANSPTPRHGSLTTVLKGLTSLATVIGVVISAYQLLQMNAGAKIERANQSVTFFLTSKDVRELSDQIASKTTYGKDYTNASSDPDLKQALHYYLNNLEMIAGNVNKGLYDEKIVFIHLAQIIYKHSRAHLLGQGGRIPAGDWKAKEALFTNNEFPELRRLYARWFPDGIYRDTLP